jgi:polysaccharide deacetylase 2 family uncharacterized protein YibQ
MRQRLNLRLLLGGYAVIALIIGGLATWAALAGPPPPAILASVTVPIDVITPPPESDLPKPDMLGAPPKPPADGMSARKPFDKTDPRPRIAIVVTELGPSHAEALNAIDHLPPEISLAFLPYATETEALSDEARLGGHEILLDVPMEPAGYPDDDPGPEALLTGNSDGENLKRLDWNLSRTSGYVGIVNFMGSRFTGSEAKLTPIMQQLHDRGLLIVDTRTNPLTAVPGLARELKVPYVVADSEIDATASRDAIDNNLAKLEDIAHKQGKAVGVAGTYPVTFERLAEWAKSLPDKGIALAPVSAVVSSPQ